MRVLKITGIVLGSLVGLLVLAAVAIVLLVDPNDHKDRIAAAVQKSTGRTLALPGELKLSLFPWVAIETGEATLGNPPGFGDEPFLSLRRARLSVKLLPLLKKQLQVARIELDGLDLKLRQNESGKGNWEDWGESSAEAAPAEAESATLDLAGLSITNSRIAFGELTAEEVNVEIGRVAGGAAIPVSMQLAFISAPGAAPLPLAAQFRLTPDLEQQRYQFADLSLSGRLQPEGAPKELAWRFATPAADLDLAKQTLAQVGFDAALGDLELIGQVEGSGLLETPALSGIFKLSEVPLRDLMRQFGIEPPVTRDAGVLGRFAAQGAWSFRDGLARLSNLAVTLDDSSLAGRFAFDTSNSGMDFALTMDRIDLDRYQAPVEESQASAPIELPVELLKPLRAKGSFSVGEIKVGGAKLSQLTAPVAVADGRARFGPLQAQLYGGSYSGDIHLDMRADTPLLTMDEHMRDIDIAALMKDYVESERLTGRGNLDMVLSARGSRGDELLRTLDGRIGLDLQDGAVEGMDVWYAIAEAQSLLKNRQLSGASNTRRTVFDSFRASADVKAGVATTSDMIIASQLLRIAGKGSTNLVTQALDFTVTATVLKAPPDSDPDTAELVRATIPVKITGTLTEPKIRPDLAGMAKERVKQEIEERKDELKEKVEDRLRDKLPDSLKGLLDR